MIHLVRLLDFLSTHIDSFGEGVIFSAPALAARCHGDSRAERFLQETAKGTTYAERLESLLQLLVRQGYLSDYDPSRQEYRVLSAIKYLFDFADRIKIREDETVRNSNTSSPSGTALSKIWSAWPNSSRTNSENWKSEGVFSSANKMVRSQSLNRKAAN
jgi:Condensin complex protein MksE